MSDVSPVLATDVRRVAVMTVLTVLAGAVDAVSFLDHGEGVLRAGHRQRALPVLRPGRGGRGAGGAARRRDRRLRGRGGRRGRGPDVAGGARAALVPGRAGLRGRAAGVRRGTGPGGARHRGRRRRRPHSRRTGRAGHGSTRVDRSARPCAGHADAAEPDGHRRTRQRRAETPGGGTAGDDGEATAGQDAVDGHGGRDLQRRCARRAVAGAAGHGASAARHRGGGAAPGGGGHGRTTAT